MHPCRLKRLERCLKLSERAVWVPPRLISFHPFEVGLRHSESAAACANADSNRIAPLAPSLLLTAYHNLIYTDAYENIAQKDHYAIEYFIMGR
jgi:hypothetical protein